MSNPVIHALFKQSLKTFMNRNVTKDIFLNNFKKLKTIMDTLTAEHINFDPEFRSIERWDHPGKAPVTFIQVYQDNNVTLAIFVLKPGMKLPLHDHPHMYGLLKVIMGKVKIQNYSLDPELTLERLGKYQDIEPSDVIAEKHDDIIADSTSECCVLEPISKNLHEIESLDGPSAFFDVLAPPYDTFIPEYGHRKCSYYAAYRQLGPKMYHLIHIPAPHWFWNDEAPYLGPELVCNYQELELDEENK